MAGARLSSARVVAEIRRLVRQPGLVKFDGHALVRMNERDISQREVRHILSTGLHATDRDQFNERYNEWSYAIDGATNARRRLRVAVTLVRDEPLPDSVLIVITAIGLD